MRKVDVAYQRGVPLVTAERKRAQLTHEPGTSPKRPPPQTASSTALVLHRDRSSSDFTSVIDTSGLRPSLDAHGVTWANYEEVVRDTLLPRGAAGHKKQTANGDRGSRPTAAVIASREESDKIFAQIRALKSADVQQFQR
eukprot:1759818-Prymnesium_polylepis.1